MGLDGGDRILPFVKMFYGGPSTFLWEDDLGGVHHILQGEGGEQGDPLMPMLFSLGQHAALTATLDMLWGSERPLAFLDYLYVVTTLERTVEVHNVLREELWRHARTRVHHGKTRIWNLTGVSSWRQQHRMQIPQREFGEAAMKTGLKIKALPSWEFQWADQNMLNQSSQRFWPTTGSCSQGSLKFKTCSVRGCCCFIVGPPERTSTSAQSDQSCRRSFPKGTMTRFGIAFASC